MTSYQTVVMRRPVVALLLAAVLSTGCSVQLTPPYSSDIDQEASALQSDFLKFAAGMQMVAGTPKGFYDQHSNRYADFEARLTVVRIRSEGLSGGVPCSRALAAAKRVRIPMSDQIARSVSSANFPSDADSASCVTILAGLAQRNMERLRGQHEARCKPAAPRILCTTLFGSPPVFRIFDAGPDSATLVSAVVITLGELLGAERDIKPASKE